MPAFPLSTDPDDREPAETLASAPPVLRQEPLLLVNGGLLAGLLLWWRLATAGSDHFNEVVVFLLAAVAVLLVLLLVNLVAAVRALWRRQWGRAGLLGLVLALGWWLLQVAAGTAGGLGHMGHY